VRRSGLLQPTALKVVAFAVVCLFVLAVLAAKIGNITFFSHRTTYSAELADATGLQPSNDVKIAGVSVGQVTGVTLQRAHALVTFAVDDDVHLHRGTQIGLQWHNVIGQQFLYLYPASSGPLLAPGSVLPLSSNVAGADVGALLNSLGPLLSALHPRQANEIVQSFADALQGDETQVNQLIDNAAAVSHTVGSVDTQVGQVITNLDQVFGALAQRSGDLGQVIGNFQTVAQSLAGHNDLLDQTVANLGTVAGEVAHLEADTHGSLSTAVADLQAVSSEIQSHDDQVAQGLSTLGPGLAGYVDISGYGQWFEIQTVYSCLANETSCTYYQPTNAPSGSGPLGAPPASGLPAPAGSSAAAAPNPAAALAGGSPAPSSGTVDVGQVLGMVAGQGGFSGSGS
jgi:phospholipid/cholesterol/gamma-HCH transport system substrate-binding protein